MLWELRRGGEFTQRKLRKFQMGSGIWAFKITVILDIYVEVEEHPGVKAAKTQRRYCVGVICSLKAIQFCWAAVTMWF